MKLRFVLALLLLAPVVYGQSTQDTKKTFTTTVPASISHWVTMTGNDLYPTCLAWEKTQSDGGGEGDTVIKGQHCYSFILGVINAYPASESFPLGTTNDQIVDVAIKYLKEHPAERGKGAWFLILKSEEEAFHVKWLFF